ncbi:hypothetical protein CSUI_007042 [Cystoisospora suis]|uniref:Uncharacterized protein n=1 Tax=Cystoisospora suis TaxID=483139 RepID=A0A2C6KF63_9APIC|nr:hypothetical protein CSUI_007042 [Cystoisospora suis]
MKLVHDQLGVCTPEDLSKVLYALLKVPPRRLGDRRPLYIRELVRALQPVLPYADIHSLSLIFSSIAEASSFSSSTNSSSSSSLVANQEEEEENPMAGLAFGALQHFHANLHDALPGHLSLFVRNLHDLVRKAERREQEGEKNKKRDLLSLMIKDIMERTIELLPFFDEAQISNFLQGSIALQNSTISSLSFDEDSLGTRAMRWTEEIVDFLRHDLVHKGGERHPFLSPSTCLSMLVSISRLPREVCEKSRDLSLFLCDYLATERLTAPSLESDGSGSSSLSSSTENGLSSSSFSLSSSSSSSLTTLESGDLSELSSYDVEEEEEIEDLLSSSSLSFRSSNEEKKKQKSEEDNSHEVETEPTIPTATPTSSSTTTTTSVSFLSPKEVQRGSLANQHERKRRRRGKNREEDAILQRLSARDYIQLLGALKDLQIYHAKLLDKLTYFLAMKMYDLREEEQETVLNLLKSLRISFSPHRLPSSFF